jgi:hypothetical protein
MARRWQARELVARARGSRASSASHPPRSLQRRSGPPRQRRTQEGVDDAWVTPLRAASVDESWDALAIGGTCAASPLLLPGSGRTSRSDRPRSALVDAALGAAGAGRSPMPEQPAHNHGWVPHRTTRCLRRAFTISRRPYQHVWPAVLIALIFTSASAATAVGGMRARAGSGEPRSPSCPQASGPGWRRRT